jgi:hypothetical protein
MRTMFMSIDGEYGDAEDLITFDPARLSDSQWETVEGLGGFDRYRYVQAILDDDTEEQARVLGEDI